jgi:hypothetical protein
MVALAAAAALAGPPKAVLHTAATQVRLTVSSWCWRGHCGAPIAASKKLVVTARGTLVAVDLAFDPKRVRVAVAGRSVAVAVHGREVSWRAARGGGLTMTVTGARGWVTYVGRLRLR